MVLFSDESFPFECKNAAHLLEICLGFQIGVNGSFALQQLS